MHTHSSQNVGGCLVQWIGLQKAYVAVARKLAVLLHRLWVTRHGSVQLPVECEAQTRLTLECLAGMAPDRRLNHPETPFTA